MRLKHGTVLVREREREIERERKRERERERERESAVMPTMIYPDGNFLAKTNYINT